MTPVLPTHRRGASILAAPLLGLLLGLAPAAHAWERELQPAGGTAPDWSHSGENGPDHWGELSPAYASCGVGRLQSPIALDGSSAVLGPCMPLRFRYRSSALYITNDGRALRLGYDRGSYLLVDGLSYELVELRFHVPAEHSIDGRMADAELQLIHGNNRGDIAILSVPMVAGHRVNQILRRVLDHAPSAPGEQYLGRNVGVNALFLIPGRKDYYAYRGSLTRPPCTEQVRWYVLRAPLEVDAGDLRRLAQLVAPNTRPLQPRGDRTIVKSCEP